MLLKRAKRGNFVEHYIRTHVINSVRPTPFTLLITCAYLLLLLLLRYTELFKTHYVYGGGA